MLTSIHFDDKTYSDEIKRRLMKSLPMADVALLRLTFCSYPKGGIFNTKLDLKNECLITHKTVFGTRNPAFWVGAVKGWLCFISILGYLSLFNKFSMV
jgi:ABC-type dipeptide/oligopeptide/nickel transport system permease component